MNNMRSLMANQMANSDLIIFNRCDENTKKNALRRSIKVLNRRAQIVYEGKDGNIMSNNEEEDLPYDINAEVVEIVDDDYGLSTTRNA